MFGSKKEIVCLCVSASCMPKKIRQFLFKKQTNRNCEKKRQTFSSLSAFQFLPVAKKRKLSCDTIVELVFRVVIAKLVVCIYGILCLKYISRFLTTTLTKQKKIMTKAKPMFLCHLPSSACKHWSPLSFLPFLL